MLGVYRIGANHQSPSKWGGETTTDGWVTGEMSGVANAAWVALVGVGVEIKLAVGVSVGLVGSARLFFWSVGYSCWVFFIR